MSSAAENYDDVVGDDTTGSVLDLAPEVVEVRRNGGLAALIGALASAIAIAYLGRAAETGAVLDWVLVVAMGVIGAAYLHAFVDARTPLLVADGQGVRLRLGRTWHGLPWGALQRVEHTPRHGLRDGRLVLVPHNTDRVLSELDSSGRRQSRLTEKLYGAPLAVPLGLSTRVPELTEDLTTSLRQLAGNTARVVEVAPGPRERTTDRGAEKTADLEDTGEIDRVEAPLDLATNDRSAEDLAEDESRRVLPDPRPRFAAAIGRVANLFSRRHDADEVDEDFVTDSDLDGGATARDRGDDRDDSGEREQPPYDIEPTVPLLASATPAPLRDPRPAQRAEVRHDLPDEDDAIEGRELRRPGSVNLVEETEAWGDRVRPIATARDTVEPLVLDDHGAEPAAEPVIGPELVAARTRIGLTVDSLAERTRIRPHVIESIEVDDFVPCGGDFYARGHLRTLTRVLGVEAAPLLKAYDEKYADAPINPRRVFEADLAAASSGGIRSTRGGPNWSVLIAAIMTLVLAWSIARLVMDSPVEIQSPAPVLNGSGGPNQSPVPPDTVTIKVTADGESHLEIRNSKGKTVFTGDVEYGEVHRIDVLPPVRVKASNAGAIDVEINGKSRGNVGADGKPATKTFRAN